VEPLKRSPSKASSAASSIGYPDWHWAALPDRQIDFLNQNWRECIGPSDTDAEGYGCGRDGKKSRHEEFMTATRSLISVVDDDESVRESLPDLVKEFGFAARAFSSPEEFLASDCVGQTKCLILDIAMPGMSGPDLQRELKLRGHQIPIVFITASTDKTVRPQLLEQGAVECLFKPFSDTALLEALNAALRVN
jgi:CheY-like chemotaxis protein